MRIIMGSWCWIRVFREYFFDYIYDRDGWNVSFCVFLMGILGFRFLSWLTSFRWPLDLIPFGTLCRFFL
jgi:hypothetical protein